MPKFRKKPDEIEARQWAGSPDQATPIIDWILSNGGTARWNDSEEENPETIRIDSLDGVLIVYPRDWIIRGSFQGEFYPMNPDLFAAAYEEVVAR